MPNKSSLQFRPIDFDKHSDLCVRFLCDTFVCSYGNADMFDDIGGAGVYLRHLQELQALSPDCIVHGWLENEIVAQIEMRVHEDTRTGMVNLFYLVSDHRGTGSGTRLQQYAVDTLRRHGARTAKLSVSPTNVRARSYYVKHGWRDLGPRPDRPYVNAMELDLAGNAELRT